MLAKKFRLPLRLSPAGEMKIFGGSSSFSVFVRRNGLGFNRVGVVVGRKVDKSAVRRHAIRRQVLHHAVNWPSQGLDIRVVAQSAAAGASRERMNEDLNRLASRLGSLSTRL